MFKVRLLRLFRKLWNSDSAHAAPEPVQDLQSRLQHLNDLYPNDELGPDSAHVTLHELRDIETNNVPELLPTEGNLGNTSKGLNHWCLNQQQRKNNASASDNRSAKRHTFEIDPRVPALETSEPASSRTAGRFGHSSKLLGLSEDSLGSKLLGLSEDSLGSKLLGLSISDAALREVTRLEFINRGKISRSLAGFNDERQASDTLLADKWDCAEYNSLFSLPDESRYGTTTEYEEDYEEDLLPYFTETLLMQEEELVGVAKEEPRVEAKPIKIIEAKQPTFATESSTALQPYKNFSENALKLIAQKPETPAPTLKWLASHTNPHIRAAVAKNPSTPSDTITVLAKDHEAGIRHSIAENPLSSMEALNLLVKDRNPLIAWRAQNTVNQIKDLQKATATAKERALMEAQKEPAQPVARDIATTEETIAFLQVIARKTNTPVRRLDDLARHADPRIRAAVAENANAPAEILWILAKDSDSNVKTKVTDNYNCPIEILESMKEDEDAYVAYQAHSVLNRILGATFGDNHLRSATWP